MALHRCATNNAGQLYLAIKGNCREVSLQLWSSHSRSKYKYITFYSSFEQNCRQIFNYSLPPRKKPT